MEGGAQQGQGSFGFCDFGGRGTSMARGLEVIEETTGQSQRCAKTGYASKHLEKDGGDVAGVMEMMALGVRVVQGIGRQWSGGPRE